MNPLHFIHLENVPIVQQLALEESLLRRDERNFCIVNFNPGRGIVMGISGHEEALLHLDRVKRDNIPVIRRFSGGGTVILDESSLMISFIFGSKQIDVTPFPEPILRWSAEVYAEAWKIPGFGLRENDYVIFDKKCGGNAQYIRKGRWLHHTSFLWDYKPENMQYLKLPEKRPKYREDRPHHEFLCVLKHQPYQDPSELIDQLKKTLALKFFIL